MSVHPTVSVIMPAYNVAAYLEAAVYSLFRQTYRDLEVVIVDDGSTDGTSDIARALAKRDPGRTTVIHQENRGLAAARNTALRAARGSVIALLDSDDVWEPGFLAAQMAILEDRPEIDIVTGNARFLGGTRHGSPVRPHPDHRPEPQLATILADEEAIFIMSVFRRRVYESIGGFNEQLRTNEDYEYWLRAANAGFAFTRNSLPLGWYRVRSESLSADDIRMLSGILRVYDEFSRALEPESAEAAIVVRQMLRFQAELLAPSARRRIHPQSGLSSKDFLKALPTLGAPRKRMAALMAQYAPSGLLWLDRIRFWRRPLAISLTPATVTAKDTMAPAYTVSGALNPDTTSQWRQSLGYPQPAEGAEPGDTLQRLHAREVAEGERFEFGSNWARFVATVDEDRILRAEESLREMLNRNDLRGLNFLDVGSGSGLFSLAARRLGARVRSFDYDPQSVACTAELRRRYFPDDPDWEVKQGSILDLEFVRSLGTSDIVYSWGVLHHTGNMWEALELVGHTVAPGGLLFIAIYNDMGSQTGRWRALKKTYVRLPTFVQPLFAALVSLPQEMRAAAAAALRGKPSEYVRTWTEYGAKRGMSKWRDIVDWVGGYPYEAAKPDAIFQFFKTRGYALETMRCSGGIGCNEFVFRRLDRLTTGQ
jgi:2-polyprenyl-6-hydroxyphenyl methylase/3-demethylubiquinone-9 3-methyltransferase